MKYKSMDNRGMMTVEASVVVPVILIIVVVYLFFGLFLIDMSVTKSEALRLADETASVWKTDGRLQDGEYVSQQLIKRNKRFLWQKSRANLTGRAKSRLKKRIDERLNVSSLKGYKVRISGEKVYVQMSLSYLSPILGSRKYAGISGWKFKCNGQADISNEEEILRRVLAKK